MPERQTAEADKRDHLTYYANRLLLRHMFTRMGLGSTGTFISGDRHTLADAKPSDELAKCRAAIAQLVAWFTQPVLDGDDLATPQYFIGQFIKAISVVSAITPAAMAEWLEQCGDPASQTPFPQWMARPLDPQSQNLKQLDLA